MDFLGKLRDKTIPLGRLRKLEEARSVIAALLQAKEETQKAVTGRRARATNWVRFYGIQEMADELKASKKSFFQTRGGTRYAIATRKVIEKAIFGKPVTVEVPTNFVRVLKDPRPPKLRKRLRRERRFAQLRAVASVGLKAAQPIS